MTDKLAAFLLGSHLVQRMLLGDIPATRRHDAEISTFCATLRIDTRDAARIPPLPSGEPDIQALTESVHTLRRIVEAKTSRQIAGAFKLGYSVSFLAYFWKEDLSRDNLDTVLLPVHESLDESDTPKEIISNLLAATAGSRDVFQSTFQTTINKITALFDRQAVFIVHGHDDGTREAVARFVERLGYEAIILHEQANQGRTIIEKFIAHSQVAFAIVLLTGDDRGGVKDVPPKSQLLRARQNVIFELGYFIAKLGRDKVCPLYQEDVELPSDFLGIVYTPLDKQGAWRMAVAREMKAAGLAVSLEKMA